MIFVTLGTQKQSFERLLDYVENSNIKEKIIVQAGHTKYKSKKMQIFDFVSYEKMNQYIDKAEIVITHCGTGSIITALKKNKKVIACARLKKFSEHVDDHQCELLNIFSEEGYIYMLNEETDLDQILKNIKNNIPKPYKSNTENFINNLKKEIDKFMII